MSREFWKNKLKPLLTTVPILRIVNTYKDIVACTNSCLEVLGDVLLQEDYVINYESRKLKEYKRNYATDDLELDVWILS